MKDQLQIVPVAMVDEVLSQALMREPLPAAIGSDSMHRWLAQMKIPAVTILSLIEP